MIRLFHQVQKRVFNRIDDLLVLKVPTLALADLADLLTEVLIIAQMLSSCIIYYSPILGVHWWFRTNSESD